MNLEVSIHKPSPTVHATNLPITSKLLLTICACFSHEKAFNIKLPSGKIKHETALLTTAACCKNPGRFLRCHSSSVGPNYHGLSSLPTSGNHIPRCCWVWLFRLLLWAASCSVCPSVCLTYDVLQLYFPLKGPWRVQEVYTESSHPWDLWWPRRLLPNQVTVGNFGSTGLQRPQNLTALPSTILIVGLLDCMLVLFDIAEELLHCFLWGLDQFTHPPKFSQGRLLSTSFPTFHNLSFLLGESQTL